MPESTPQLHLAQLLKYPFEALLGRLHEELAAAGFADIRPAHGCVLQYAEPDGSRLTDLARAARLKKPTVLAAVDDLVRLGYAERLPDPQDRRAKLVRLTPRGAAAAAEGQRIIASIERDWQARIGPRRARELRRSLEELHAAITRGDAQPAAPSA